MLLDPSSPGDESKASVLLLRGTASATGRDILADRDYPSGLRDDMRWKGVGCCGVRRMHRWFEAHLDRVRAVHPLCSWIDAAAHAFGNHIKNRL